MKEDRTLKGMIAYVILMSQLTVEGFVNVDWFYGYVSGYAKFLQLKLELWMFIPCGKDGKPLEKPGFYYNDHALSQLEDVEKGIALGFNAKAKEYKAAQDRVIFEGFELTDIEGHQVVTTGNITLFTESFSDLKVLSLVKRGLTLTQSKYNELYK